MASTPQLPPPATPAELEQLLLLIGDAKTTSYLAALHPAAPTGASIIILDLELTVSARAVRATCQKLGRNLTDLLVVFREIKTDQIYTQGLDTLWQITAHDVLPSSFDYRFFISISTIMNADKYVHVGYCPWFTYWSFPKEDCPSLPPIEFRLKRLAHHKLSAHHPDGQNSINLFTWTNEDGRLDGHMEKAWN
ncbi:hypothetical protein GGX14DRAFT_406376 [Mycena pura]|uniref:Uncharacterized protein n=1 Tax=Mycena pura TaxID=153505 RepID=A0AAD6Y5J6_9AGAR|nr:hypothetical protein GGX14DRAFT_406376 [Mycena pura]